MVARPEARAAGCGTTATKEPLADGWLPVKSSAAGARATTSEGDETSAVAAEAIKVTPAAAMTAP